MDAKVRYNAERISRTEIARAHNEAVHARYDDDELVTGYRWALSSRHEIVDEYTMLAEIDNGAGPGVYRKGEVPDQPVHPNCLCDLIAYYGETPGQATFATVNEYLNDQDDRTRAAMIGKANAASPVLYQRALDSRGISFAERTAAERRRVPGELIEDKKDLHSGAESGILDNKGGGALGFKRIEGEITNQRNLEVINPKFGTSGEYNFNCGNCTVANELRRQGYDVEALPTVIFADGNFKGMYIEDLADMFDGATVQYASTVSTTDVASEMIPRVERGILKWGEGARGAIFGEWDNDKGGSHLFSLEIRNGAVKYDDGQTGKENVNHLERMKPQTVRYVRLDSTTPNDKVINAVQNRRQ
jgi:hypothetical protein